MVECLVANGSHEECILSFNSLSPSERISPSGCKKASARDWALNLVAIDRIATNNELSRSIPARHKSNARDGEASVGIWAFSLSSNCGIFSVKWFDRPWNPENAVARVTWLPSKVLLQSSDAILSRKLDLLYCLNLFRCQRAEDCQSIRSP